LPRDICIARAADDCDERITWPVGFDPLDEAAGDSLGKVFGIAIGDIGNATVLE
jgi:hypothetical protein